MQEEKGPIEKLTDTHYNSRDGDGEFNWRFIYNVHFINFRSNYLLQIQFYKLFVFIKNNSVVPVIII